MRKITDALPHGAITALAKQFGTSAQLVAKVLNGEIKKSRTLNASTLLEAAEKLILEDQSTNRKSEAKRKRILKVSKL